MTKNMLWDIKKGCYGSNIAFDPASSVCLKCADLAACENERNRRRPMFLAQLDGYHDAKGVSLKVRYLQPVNSKVTRSRVKEKPAVHPDILNEASQKIYGILVSRSIDLALLKRKVNPLDGVRAPEFLRIVVERLLTAPISKSEMQNILADRLGIRAVVANNYLNIAISLLAGLKIVNPANHTLEIIE